MARASSRDDDAAIHRSSHTAVTTPTEQPRRPSVKEIFLEISDLPPEQWETELAARCGEDAQLRAGVQALLDAAGRAGGFLGGPTMPDHAASSLAADAPKQIGPYRILQTIGEGGFGTVYLAEQERPVRRRVALKIIKLGMDTKQVVARFEAERQALAVMDHPNIARVFDAGAAETGRPYFVMELVHGVPITEYCDSHNLTIDQRLELFGTVCQAVQHAHHKGIIHRDIKPSNVLVSEQDGKPFAKVIDFGIAKATSARLTEKTLFTEQRQLIGTPEYMSPEQAEGSLDIDTRADIYGLGVLLYELLTGSAPFTARELRSKAYGEIQRIIREVEPQRPSARLSQSTETLPGIAAHRSIEPRKLNTLMRGELDWIVMKCLEKDRTRRYESAAALAIDVSKYLHGGTVSAAPPSAAYRLRKFVRRNKGPVIASAAVFAALLAGVIGTTIGLIGQSRQRAIAEAVSTFQADMLASADPDKLLGDKVTVVQTITAAVKELDAGKLKDQPLVEAGVRDIIGTTLRALGRFDDAEPNLRKALELRRANLSAGDRRVLHSLELLGLLLQDQAKLDEAESPLREALALSEKNFSAESPEVAAALNNLGRLKQAQGKYDEAEPLYRRSLAIDRKLHPGGHREVALDLNNLSDLLQEQGKLAEAEPLRRESLEISRRVLPAGHPDISRNLNNLGTLLHLQGKRGDAEAAYREALEMDRRSYPQGHPSIALTLDNLANVLRSNGQLDEAENLSREALEIFRKTLPRAHPSTCACLNSLGLTLVAKGKRAEAEPIYREALALARESLPPGHPSIGAALHNLAALLQDQGKFPEAEQLFRESLAIFRAVFPDGHATLATSLDSLGWLLQAEGKLADAAPIYIESIAMQRKLLPPDHPDLAVTLSNLALLYRTQGKFAEAQPLYVESLAITEKSFGKHNRRTGIIRMQYGRTLLGLGRFPDAEAELLESERVLGQDPTAVARHRQCVDAVIELYTAWDKSDPDKGYDAKAGNWRARLPATAPATNPSTGPARG